MTVLRRGLPAVTSVILALSAAAAPAAAQQVAASCGTGAPTASRSSKNWSAPLDRVVTLRAGMLPLRQALTRVASAANVRLSFSTDLLPAKRSACMSFSDVPIGDILAFMLRDSGLEAAVAGANQIVLTRARTGEASDSSTRVVQLDPVYGTAEARVVVERRTPAFSVTVLDASNTAWLPGGDLVQVLNSSVPGMWLWSGGAAGVTANYGSTRGASSFGASGPKVFIDGIEIANPLLLAHLTMDAVERIEVIRGPQGAARYGADALNGVTNIITRHDTSGAATRLRAASTLGMAATQFANDAAVTQDHSVRVQLGRTAKSLDLNLGIGSIGDFAPGAASTHATADGSLRFVLSRAVLTGTVRYLSQSVDTTGSTSALNALPQSALTGAFASAAMTQALSLREFTAGFNASFSQNDRWSHSFVAGVDGYRLGGVSVDPQSALTSSDAILLDAGTSGLRTTLRGNSVLRSGHGSVAIMLTFTADHSRVTQDTDNMPLYDVTAGTVADSSGDQPPRPEHRMQAKVRAPEREADAQTRSSLGTSTELSAIFDDRLTLTGAMRVEHNTGATAGAGRTNALPMLGASYDAKVASADVRLRASFGKGVRWPSIGGLRDHMQLSRLTLEPEQQTGLEAGIDVNLRRALTLQVTRFHQTATGLAQQIALPVRPDDRAPARMGVAVQNVGAIRNRGWEMLGTLRHGALSLSSAATFLDSRVERVALAYTGDLQAGDRPLAVPARTISVSGAVRRDSWSASVTAYRAADWINYDRIAISRAQSADSAATLNLRDYWKAYDGFTHIGFNTSRNLGSGLVLSFGGSNLLNRQLGEPDNITIVPGRTFSVGLRAAF